MSENLAACAGSADRFAVVDTETTGLFDADRVVEIAIITLDLNGRTVDVFDTLVNPCRDLTAGHIHGITPTMVADAPTFDEIAGDVALRLDGACLVGHNVRFDARMLGGEFVRLGTELIADRALDTYRASGARLADSCARFGVSLAGAHRARNDARATAELFLRLGSACGRGGPVRAPVGLHRGGRVRPRDGAAVVRPPTPLIVHLLTQLSCTNLEIASQQYLEMVARAVGDLHLDREERAQLNAIAGELGLTAPEIGQAHRRFVHELVDAALEDQIVTDGEYDSLVRVASALEVDQDLIERRIASYRETRGIATFGSGMEVVFTGASPERPRDELEDLARARGLVPKNNVTRTTDVVVAVDPESRSGKAMKAREYGIPIVAMDEFVAVDGRGSAPAITASESRQVVTCPDCLATRTVPRGHRLQREHRCDQCAAITASRSQRPVRSQVEVGLSWGPPSIEWRTCRDCGTVWAHEVRRGRKLTRCPSCSGASPLPPPSGSRISIQSGRPM